MRTPSRKTIKHLMRILNGRKRRIRYGHDDAGKIHSVHFENGEFHQGVLFNLDTQEFIRITVEESGVFEFTRICSPKQLEDF